MKLNYLKQIIRGWLPPEPNSFHNIRRYSAPIAIGLAVTLISISVFAASSNFIFGSTVVRPLSPNTGVNDTAAQNITHAAASQNTTLTREQALAIAMPIIQQYATENNRIITNVTVSSGTMADLEGSRGGPTLEQILSEGNVTPPEARSQFKYYPIWSVGVTFQWEMPQMIFTYDANGTIVDGRWPSNATWVNGFGVIIWADNGQIDEAGPTGVD